MLSTLLCVFHCPPIFSVFKALMKQSSSVKYWKVVSRPTLGCKIVWNQIQFGKRKQQIQMLAPGFELLQELIHG